MGGAGTFARADISASAELARDGADREHDREETPARHVRPRPSSAPAARFDVVLVATVALTFALGRSADAAVLDVGFLHLHARVIGASSYP